MSMKHPRICHDCCWKHVDVVLDMFQDVLPPEALPECRAQLYEALLDLLRRYQSALEDERQRLRPLRKGEYRDG